MLPRRVVFPFAALLLALLPIRPAAAQSPQSQQGRAPSPRFSLRGNVLDQTRAPIAGARVSVVSDGPVSGSSAVSDQSADFTLVLDAGSHTITVVANGFLAVSQTVNAPQTGSQSLEFILRVAGIHETVTVAVPAGYRVPATNSATRTPTPLRDVPQSVTVVTEQLIKDQLMMSVGDVMRYVPGISAHQGENTRDQVIIRGTIPPPTSSSTACATTRSTTGTSTTSIGSRR